MTNDANTLSWIVVAILSFVLYHMHGTVKEYEALNSHTMSRMQSVESNLLAAKRKIVDIKNSTKEVDDALIEIRAEIGDLRKYLGKK
jgi:hypothetical protein